MKILVIGGNRFVGLRVTNALDQRKDIDLHILNRTGQAAHVKNATIYKGDRLRMETAFLDRDWDVVVDFACYTEKDARGGLQFFGKVGRYIHISTVSVYGERPIASQEEDFDPKTFDLKQPPESSAAYQDGKRRAEAVFYQESQIPVLAVRFPVIVGPDDYTNRLAFHVDRVIRQEPIFIPFPEIKLSLIHSEDAAKFLVWAIAQKNLNGPLNVCAKDPISLSAMMGQIELVTGIKPIMAAEEKDGNSSPYGGADSFYMNVEKMLKAGFTARPIADWLPALIGIPPRTKPRFVH